MNYRELKELVLYHGDLYYNKSLSEITDAEYDKLYADLEKVEKAQGWVEHDSPTISVGGAAGKVAHPIRLYSLNKVYDINEVDEQFDIKTPKIDGTNITLIYRFGRLKLALTRGNGDRGDNVVHLVKHISNIPTSIDSIYDQIIINGECVTDNQVENFRNYVSGALGLKSEAEFKNRNIKFIAHDFLGVDLDYVKRMNIVADYGFTTVLSKDIEKYPTDGVVYRADSYKLSKKLGYTSKYPRFAVALKSRELTTAITTLQEVIWVIGRTGTVNPTGIITPVVLDDATISRVSLHNLSIIEQHNLGLGDTIEIERAGGVIPKFLRVIKHAEHNVKISIKDAELAIKSNVVRDGPRLFVADKNNVNRAKVVEHFVKTMEIKGLGPANIKKLGINHPADLFDNSIKWDTIGVVGDKVRQEVERAKTKPYETVLASLGIPGLGKSTAKLIVTKINRFVNLPDIQYVDVKGIGPSTIESVMTWYEENKDWVLDLPLQLEQEVAVERLLPKDLKKVCITGTLDITRAQLTEILEDRGYKVVTSITRDCYALITAGDNTSSKYTKAVNQGIEIIDYWSRKKDVLSGSF